VKELFLLAFVYALLHQKSYPAACSTGGQEPLAVLSAGELGEGDGPRITSSCHSISRVSSRWARILRMPRWRVPPSGKGDMFLFTIRYKYLIDELSAVISINPQDRKREQRLCALEGCQHGLPTAVQEREASGSACRNVGEGQGIQVASLRFYAAMGDQICLRKARLRFVPVLKDTNGNLVFEQRSCLGGGYPARTVSS
jgi:hypothetical protein